MEGNTRVIYHGANNIGGKHSLGIVSMFKPFKAVEHVHCAASDAREGLDPASERATHCLAVATCLAFVTTRPR